jgi:hypothetical protein
MGRNRKEGWGETGRRETGRRETAMYFLRRPNLFTICNNTFSK